MLFFLIKGSKITTITFFLICLQYLMFKNTCFISFQCLITNIPKDIQCRECCKNSILSAGLLYTKCVEGIAAMKPIFQVKGCFFPQLHVEKTVHVLMLCVTQGIDWLIRIWGYICPETLSLIIIRQIFLSIANE